MGAGAVVLSAIKLVGEWVVKNPGFAADAVEKVVKIRADKVAKEEQLMIMDEKMNQLGEATLELDQKIADEIGLVHEETDALCLQIETLTKEFDAYRATTKKTILAMAIIMGVAVITAILLAVIL